MATGIGIGVGLPFAGRRSDEPGVYRPASASIVYTGQTPSLIVDRVLSPASAGITYAGQAPAVSVITTLSPASASISYAGQTPTVSVDTGGPNLGSTLAAWWEVADLDTLFEERTGASATTPASVDGVVGTVLDKSGNGVHLVAPSDAARPVLRQSGSTYYLELDGTDDRFTSVINASNTITNAIHEIWIAAEVRSKSTNLTENSDPNLLCSNNAGWCHFGSYNSANTTIINTNFDGTRDYANVTHDITNPTVLHARHDSGNLVASANGGSETSTASGNTSNTTFLWQVGAAPAQTNYAAANWYGCIIVGETLTSGERAENLTYMGNLMGLSL